MTQASISPSFQQNLEELRDSLNFKFRMTLKQGAKIDPIQFQRHVLYSIGPIVDAVHAILPERTRIVTSELYDVSLELFAAKQLGPESTSVGMAQLWSMVMPRMSVPIARSPRRVVGSLCNGLLFAEKQHAIVANRWINHLGNVADLVDGTDHLLAVGKVAAWLSGMAQFRTTALEIASTLPASMVARLLGFEAPMEPKSVQACISRLRESPWAAIDDTPITHETKPKVRRVQTCGGFRGFGGVLMAPPRVFVMDRRLMVSDASQVWQLVADRFGWTMVRADLDPSASEAPNSKEIPRIHADGSVHWGDQTIS
jgi:hypothetical protein